MTESRQAMVIDRTRLRVSARGNHDHGYTGVVVIEDGYIVWERECRHEHRTTTDARDCVRRMVRRALDGPS